MSEYSELIKRFDKIRDYMRDFYVYGFMSREDFKQKKSLRSYDNEKRRIESYLGDYMSFRLNESGKIVCLSVDSSTISENPLYRAFKAKTFTKNDITLNFIILDILREKGKATATEIANCITEEYQFSFEEPIILDLSTVRNKLKEYVEYGILTAEKQGKNLFYQMNDLEIDLNSIRDALMFFSEVSPLGVVGSYLLDRCSSDQSLFLYKHHYIMHALESEIVYDLLKAIHQKQAVEIMNHSARSEKPVLLEIVPLRFMISVQGGRRYLAAYSIKAKSIVCFRLDYIKSVKQQLELWDEFDLYIEQLDEILSKTWGVSFGRGRELEHLTMYVDILKNESYIIERILREGRHGTLIQVDENRYRYDISVYDALEMIPWIRTFIGRIVSLKCSNKSVTSRFYKDLDRLYSLYGGDSDVI